MKFKFVRKGKDISSEQVSQLMDFGQLADKAAGMSAAPLAKGALASKSAVVSKAIWIAAVPVTAAGYLVVTELTSNPDVEVPVETQPHIEMTEAPEPAIVADTVDIEKADMPTIQPVEPAEPSTASEPVAEEEEAEADTDDTAAEEANDMLLMEDIMIRAEPEGGYPAFYEKIDKELTYPESARINNTEGMVRIFFIVDKYGKAGNFRVTQSLGKEFDKEALRVMNKLTDWKPATHNGQPVTTHLTIKLRFELEKE